MGLSHINEKGYARMVDVSGKEDTVRIARAQAVVCMQPDTLTMIREGAIKKGDVLAVAQVAGIMGAKQTSQIIPMCHPLFLSGVDLDFRLDETGSSIVITSQVKTTGKTGVEMEALAAVNIAALTIYDMCKAVDRWMEITDIRLLEKSGGKSGYLISSKAENVFSKEEDH
jgi:cyclic pyranopterin phosphate synthase